MHFFYRNGDEPLLARMTEVAKALIPSGWQERFVLAVLHFVEPEEKWAKCKTRFRAVKTPDQHRTPDFLNHSKTTAGELKNRFTQGSISDKVAAEPWNHVDLLREHGIKRYRVIVSGRLEHDLEREQYFEQCDPTSLRGRIQALYKEFGVTFEKFSPLMAKALQKMRVLLLADGVSPTSIGLPWDSDDEDSTEEVASTVPAQLSSAVPVHSSDNEFGR